jgi:hypothetical protein
MRIHLAMNPYLFGCLILMVFWLITLAIVWKRPTSRNWYEFWWGSITCTLLGFTEPLFVPEYWNPPSILAWHRWDFESFLFCFAVGGITAAAPEWKVWKGFFVGFDNWLIDITRGPREWFRRVTGTPLYVEPPPTADQVRRDNSILAAFFMGAFGFTAHLGLNIIYDSSIACIATGAYIAWRRPLLRWQLWAGGVSFMLIYSVVLFVTGVFYPTFYDEHWNLAALSGWRIGHAPVEELLFAATMGTFWAPLYEAMRIEHTLQPRRNL